MKIISMGFFILSLAFAGGVHADTGIIRLFNEKRSFGFINPDQGPVPLLFVGSRVLEPQNGAGLESGDRVSYDVFISAADSYSSGPYKSAKNIRKIH